VGKGSVGTDEGCGVHPEEMRKDKQIRKVKICFMSAYCSTKKHNGCFFCDIIRYNLTFLVGAKMDAYRRANRALWNEWTAINAQSALYRLDELRKGKNKLNGLEREEVGDVSGRSLLHLQCHFGMDTLSWAMLGARVTGVDFSEEAIRLARSLSNEMNLPARFLCCDIYELEQNLQETFDIVYASYGFINWLSDLETWAKIVARYVRPGGFVYLAEFHPFGMLFDETVQAAEWRVGYDYFCKDMLQFEVNGSYADRSAVVQQAVSYEWMHSLSEIINSLLKAGLQLEFFNEHDFTVYEMFPFLEAGTDTIWRIPDGMKRVPLMFSLRARKPLG
jgi:SAM-dependent methyltransferase